MAAPTGSHSRILVALLAGALAGSVVNYAIEIRLIEKSIVDWVVKYVTGPLGKIFINLLYFGIIPLVFASLALGVTRLGGRGNLGRIGFKTISYFIITTACCRRGSDAGQHYPPRRSINRE